MMFEPNITYELHGPNLTATGFQIGVLAVSGCERPISLLGESRGWSRGWFVDHWATGRLCAYCENDLGLALAVADLLARLMDDRLTEEAVIKQGRALGLRGIGYAPFIEHVRAARARNERPQEAAAFFTAYARSRAA